MSVKIGDMEFDLEALREHRKQVISLRDAALEQDNFQWAVILSHNVALLGHLIDMVTPVDNLRMKLVASIQGELM